jgi:hypothetical protein
MHLFEQMLPLALCRLRTHNRAAVLVLITVQQEHQCALPTPVQHEHLLSVTRST